LRKYLLLLPMVLEQLDLDSLKLPLQVPKPIHHSLLRELESIKSLRVILPIS
jgi:hypothetical protein